jgi:hypothetical protein
VTLLPFGCEHSQESAATMALATQLESVSLQSTFSFAAANCAANC